LGIAGFAMGNAMMSAFPEYFGLTEMGNAALLLFFRWSTAFFASVSLLVAGRFYIENAFKALRSAQWSLDIPIAVGMMSLWGWSAWLLISGILILYLD
jgi:Cu+-exporting ATPase